MITVQICFREGCRDGLFDAGKSASADNHNILHSTVLKLIQSAQPELSALMFANGKRQRFLTPATGKSKNEIRLPLKTTVFRGNFENAML